MNRRFQHRCIVLCALLGLCLSALSVRLVQLQVVDHTYYATRSHNSSYRKEILAADRGLIVDRNDEPLARSIPIAALVIDKNHLLIPGKAEKVASFWLAWHEASNDPAWEKMDPKKRRRTTLNLREDILESVAPTVIIEKHLAHAVGVLAAPLGLTREELRRRIVDSSGTWVTIAKDIPAANADRIREIVRDEHLVGFNFDNSLKRWYPSPTLATHITGFTGELKEEGEDGKPRYRVVGKFGVEAAMEQYLAGSDGWREFHSDPFGQVVPGGSSSLMPPRSGLNVKLTIDMGIQTIVEEELDAGLKEFEAERGTVILMDPKTGEVLALASRPQFDLNLRDNLDEASQNFAIQAVYEPGSTYKIVGTSGVLNEGLATPYTTVFCHNGFLQCNGYFVKDDHPAGTLTLEGVLAKSNNIGAYKFATQLGPARFYQYVANFGFNKPTGIQLSGESAGLARNTHNACNFSRASYGYALNVTPLQMACAYSALASDGNLRKPHIVKSLIANDGTVVEDYQPEIVRQVVKPKVAKQMRAALEKVVSKTGTAERASVPGFRVAGKTGTAKKIHPKGGYLDGHYTVSFIGMMPAEDPAFVCAVIIDDPRTTQVKHYGGTISAPIFAKVATRVAPRLNLQPTEAIKGAPVASNQ